MALLKEINLPTITDEDKKVVVQGALIYNKGEVFDSMVEFFGESLFRETIIEILAGENQSEICFLHDAIAMKSRATIENVFKVMKTEDDIARLSEMGRAIDVEPN